MATVPQLTASTSGDVLELRVGGPWTAAHVKTLEALSLSGRRVIEIANPNLGPDDPRADDPVWHFMPPR